METAELPEEIDQCRAEAALERAMKRLEEKEKDLDEARAKYALARAEARLSALKKEGKD